MSSKVRKILEINASARQGASVTRQLSRDLISALHDRFGDLAMTRRDLAAGIPLLDEAWIEANLTPDDARTALQQQVLAYSDALVAELEDADTVVIAAPIYNFSIPASLKAWIDMIARARKTFRYTEDGPRGLLTNKKAYVIVASGGVAIGSPADFATPYLRYALAFVGIDDVEIIAAEQINNDAAESMDRARAQIAELVHLSPMVA